ncbi:MAG: gamma-glutamyl kinase [Omnitrophica WOR_2 bacterium SM23_29]|nr:MAG: gamma-glutamyl kinase [Omnitrophica WOR_2 bacterium SM23_29]
MRNKFLSNLKLVVIKVGTSVLASKTHPLERQSIRDITCQICALLDKGIKVVLVSSGAIGAGMNLLGLKVRPKTLEKLQATAAIGQSQLMKAYEEDFKSHGKIVAQVLLTREDLEDRKRYLNAKNTIFTILDYDAIPIINENDTVSVEEIKFGDNDTLAGLVANLIGADLLIILSDIDGLRRHDGKGEIIDIVKEITGEIERLATGTTKEASVGGMVTKIKAAKVVTDSGIPLIIANGKTDDILIKIIDGKRVGTLFIPRLNKMTARKRWIAFSTRPKGSVVVDTGAKQALTEKEKSLLSSGIIGVEGKFEASDIISIKDERGREFARGLVNYSSEEVKKIEGANSKEIEKILGYKYYDEVVHRDNLVII